MFKTTWCLALVLLASSATWAQVPPLLVGQWEARQISLIALQNAPDSVRERLDVPAIGDLNVAIMRGEERLLVDFRADGSYQFSVTRGAQLVRAETGTYSVAHDTLYASSPGSAGGSSFNEQRLSRLTRRGLSLVFLVGSELPGVVEEIEYRRLKP